MYEGTKPNEKKKTLTIYNISKRGIWQYRTCNLQTTYLEWDTYIRELYVAVTNQKVFILKRESEKQKSALVVMSDLLCCVL